MLQDRGASDLYRWWQERRKKVCAALFPTPLHTRLHTHAVHLTHVPLTPYPQGVSDAGWLLNAPHPTPEQLAAAFPLAPPSWSALASGPALGSPDVQVTWMGHACCLVQMQGLTFLTDPALGERCAPVQWAGPKRLVPVPFDICDSRVPAADFILISHSHFDHLCYATVKKLLNAATSQHSACSWFVPLGLKAWLVSAGVRADRITELDWWQESSVISGVRIACTPAQHWTQRAPWDRCASLWCGWAVLGADATSSPAVTRKQPSFWFAGDSGYCDAFKDIGACYGGFTCAAIPIGAYAPRWFHGPAHMDPGEAVKVHADVAAAHSVAIHHATWALTDEALDEPVQELQAACGRDGVSTFQAVKHGETRVFTASDQP